MATVEQKDNFHNPHFNIGKTVAFWYTQLSVAEDCATELLLRFIDWLDRAKERGKSYDERTTTKFMRCWVTCCHHLRLYTSDGCGALDG
jgi:hypothetical protein